MTTNVSSMPRSSQWGVKDESTRQLLLEEVSIPQHCPLSTFFAAWGTEEPTLFQGSGMIKMYGSETFDETGKYATHQTPFVNIFKKNSNPQMMKRITPPNARQAMLRVSVEAIKTNINKYVRNEDGTIQYRVNEFNQSVPVVEETFVGTRLVIHTGVDMYSTGGSDNPINNREFGLGRIVRDFRESTVVGANGSTLGAIAGDDTVWTSTLFPILDLPLAYKGSRGDDFGLRVGLPTSTGINPIDTASAYNSLSYLLRLGIVERNKVTGGFDIVNTSAGSVSVDVSFKQGAKADRTGNPLAIDTIFIPEYVTSATNTQPEYKGPFGDIYLYRDAIEELQKLLIVGDSALGIRGEIDFNEEASLSHGRYPLTLDSQYLLNFLGGYDIDGIPYYSFETSSSATFGGVNITADTVLYAAGGEDGLLTTSSGDVDELANLELFDSSMRQLFTTFNNGEYRWLNTAKYPISAVWDSGYSIETKKAMLNVIGTRKDTAVYLAAQSQADYVSTNVDGIIKKVWSWVEPNDEATETSIAGTLRAFASAYPESEVYGTPVCRAVIIGQCGNIVNSNYTRKLPLTYELADKVSRFMGAADGYWREEAAFDQPGNNIISLMENINLGWKMEDVARKMWANGLTYAEDYDLRNLFFAAVRTVYVDDTSVLNSAITMAAICYVERVQTISWRRFTGNGKFRREKFIQQMDEFIRERLTGRFDDRFVFEVETEFTQADQAAGYSWTTNVTIYAPGMLTVGKYSIISRRISDLDEVAA